MSHLPKYDIAYSMLALDEPYARRLMTELKKRLPGEQYVYSRKTEDAAELGEPLETFGPIFLAESRLIVLLYRPGWGSTPFTAVEERAIKARTLSGLGIHSIFVVAMQPPHIPDWYPEHEFWADADVYSVPQISAMIEFALARQRGGSAPASPAQAPVIMPAPERVPRHVEPPPPLEHDQASAPATTEAEKLFGALGVEVAELTRAGPSRPALEQTSTACTVTYNQTVMQLKLVKSEPTPYVHAVLTAWVNVSDDSRQSLPFGEWRLMQILDKKHKPMWQFDDALLSSQQLARSLMERLVELANQDRSNPRIVERSITPRLS